MQRRKNMSPKITKSEGIGSGRNYPVTPFRLFEDFFNDWAVRATEGRRPEAWNPPVDVVEREGNLLLMISLPGVNEKEIGLKVEGQVLTIKGERKSLESEGFTYHQMEGHYGNFSRSFTLPDSTDLDNIKADYKNGVLTISIPQKPEVKPRTIKVNV
jgi:HSP20 family protein